ncbi:MAG: glycosyltransferase family 4 protein [Anaerotruncus sp.]|nr:MAG: glycosyltransferase family 4 protein [Anaerotruncus sp.]
MQAAKELPGIKFVFAGTGPLEDLCKNIPNIEYAGFKSGKELSDLIENAEFSICPSECHENCPMTVAESVSLGTPVIGSDLGGIPELIKNGKTGIVFEAGNKEALKAAIQTLYSDKELSSEMAQNCRSESFNDIEKYTERLSEIYSDLISKNG